MYYFTLFNSLANIVCGYKIYCTILNFKYSSKYSLPTHLLSQHCTARLSWPVALLWEVLAWMVLFDMFQKPWLSVCSEWTECAGQWLAVALHVFVNCIPWFKWFQATRKTANPKLALLILRWTTPARVLQCFLVVHHRMAWDCCKVASTSATAHWQHKWFSITCRRKSPKS